MRKAFLRKALAHKPDVAVVDIQMPPGARRRWPSRRARAQGTPSGDRHPGAPTAAVEKHVTSIFHKLGLQASPTDHRRVLAALTYLRDAPS